MILYRKIISFKENGVKWVSYFTIPYNGDAMLRFVPGRGDKCNIANVAVAQLSCE
jgi:hypothetical protein